MSIRAVHLMRQLMAEHTDLVTLRRRQFVKLKRLVWESYTHTEAWRCLMQRAGVRPGDIDSLADIERLPIVDKNDLLEFSEAERSHRKRVQRFRTARLATSGSSGNPFEFIVDASYNAWRKAQYLRPYVTNGRRPWHSVLRLTAYPRRRSAAGSPFNPFRERQIYCVAAVDEQVSAFETLRPTIVQGYPSALRCLAFEINARNIPVGYVETVFTDSELLTPDSRAIIERAFDAPVIDVFGAYETDNIAYQCSRDSDYHVALDSVIYEVTRNGNAVKSGDGDLVVTVLNNLTMPFIRYNLNDRVESLPVPCSCGRTFPLIRISAGRNDDLVIAGDGRRSSPMSFLWRLDAFSELIREYQIAQTDIDRFDARVVPARNLSDKEQAQIRCLITADYPQATVQITQQQSLPRSPAGKLKAFVCEVPSAQRKDCGR